MIRSCTLNKRKKLEEHNKKGKSPPLHIKHSGDGVMFYAYISYNVCFKN